MDVAIAIIVNLTIEIMSYLSIDILILLTSETSSSIASAAIYEEYQTLPAAGRKYCVRMIKKQNAC
jgi:hypothetical protein